MSNGEFAALNAKLGKRARKKLQNNTYAYKYKARWPHRPGEDVDTIAVVLHHTAIIYHCEDAYAAFNHRYTDTVTTRARMRAYEPPGPSFHRGSLGHAGSRIAEIPHLGAGASRKHTPDNRAMVATDLGDTYVVETYANGRVTIWQPARDGSVPYDVVTDDTAITYAIDACCRAIHEKYGALAVVLEMQKDKGDLDVVGGNLARAVKLFLLGDKLDHVMKALVFRRRRPPELKGKIAWLAQALAIAETVCGVRDWRGLGEDHYRAHQTYQTRNLLGEVHLRNRMTGECVPLNLDEPNKDDTWALLLARAFYSAKVDDEQDIQQAGEAGAHAGVGREVRGAEALAGQAG